MTSEAPVRMPTQRTAHACVAISALAWLVVLACRGEPNNRPPAGSAAASEATAAQPPAGPDTSALRGISVDSLPAAAAAVLGAASPGFVVWGDSQYPDAVRAEAAKLRNGRLSVLSGHFRNPTYTDYAVAGFEPVSRRARVFVLASDASGTFRAIPVFSTRGPVDSAAVAPFYLLSSSVERGPAADIFVHALTSAGLGRRRQFTWDAERREFLEVVPD